VLGRELRLKGFDDALVTHSDSGPCCVQIVEAVLAQICVDRFAQQGVAQMGIQMRSLWISRSGSLWMQK
jgi:hypothetical protein